MFTGFYRRVVSFLGSSWGVGVFGTLAVVSLVAMQVPLAEMQDHGVGFDDLQYAGTTEKADEFVGTLGDEGRRAAWTVLAIEFPWIAGFALLISAWCLVVAERLAGHWRLTAARALRAAAWCGPLAAACDLVQNVAVAFMLEGRTGQPAPQVSEVAGTLTWVFVGAGVLAIGAGAVLLLVDRMGGD